MSFLEVRPPKIKNIGGIRELVKDTGIAEPRINKGLEEQKGGAR